MNLTYHIAQPNDAQQCVVVRGQTRENAVSEERPRTLGITAQSWGADIAAGTLPGHFCRSNGASVGFCFGSTTDGEIVVLVLLPAFENLGIGRELLTRMVAQLAALGKLQFFLGCSRDPQSRSYGFYRHLGWRSTGTFDGRGDEILEYFVDPL